MNASDQRLSQAGSRLSDNADGLSLVAKWWLNELYCNKILTLYLI